MKNISNIKGMTAAEHRYLVNEAYGGESPLHFANEGDDRVQPGQITMANESRFIEANFSEPLTTFATGWKDPNNIEDTLEFVAPTVPVGRRFEFIQATNAEEFLSEIDTDIRGIGASFKRIEYTSHKVNSKTFNKGLTIRVDEDSVLDMPNWEQVYTGRIMRRLLRNELRRGITLLSAAATNTNKTWEAGTGIDPDFDAHTAKLAFADAAGLYPNRVLFGDGSWNLRWLTHRAQNTAGGFASAGLDEAGVAKTLQVEGVKVSHERYQSSAAAKSRIINNTVLLYLAEANQTPEDPSSIKRFVSNTQGGTPFRVYVQRYNVHLIDITVEHYSNIVVTSTLGIQQLTIS